MSARRATLTGAAFAVLSIALKLLIVRYGLPYEFNPDEPYILKDPFKLTFLYTSGDFRSPTDTSTDTTDSSPGPRNAVLIGRDQHRQHPPDHRHLPAAA